AIAIEFFGSKGIGIATGVLTFVILVFGEITPKSISAENAERISLVVAKPIKFFIKFFSPLVYILTLITGPVTKRSGKRRVMITEDEIRLLVEMGEKEGVIEKEEKEMIKGVFEVGDMVAKEVMIPRVDMVCIEVNESIDEALKLIRETGFSRIPVYEGNRDNIVGILYAKDIIRHLNKKIKIKDIMRPPFFIPETKSLRELLREMQKLKLHMAIVVDEYGGTAGLVTLEDIIEEIVGEIMDEVDEEEELIRRIDENTWLVNARARIEEVNEILNLEIPEDEFETIGGFVFNKLGKIPKIGDYIEIDGVKITVEKMKDKRIRKVRITVNR
ncbi:MAG: hemolysin, partial [Candidatus Hydrothermarchaeota archaeon]